LANQGPQSTANKGTQASIHISKTWLIIWLCLCVWKVQPWLGYSNWL